MLLVDWLFEKLQINLQMKVLKLSKVSKFFKTEKVSKDILFNYKKKKTATVTKHEESLSEFFIVIIYSVMS